MASPILAPAAVLVAWSLLMLVWLAAARFPALTRTGIDLKQARPGGRGQDLETVLPPEIMWKSHNYTHLMEQPTLFYALVAILALAGAGSTDAALAWGYTGTRIVHSLYQATINKVAVRLALFTLSTLFLIGLTVRALLLTL